LQVPENGTRTFREGRRGHDELNDRRYSRAALAGIQGLSAGMRLKTLDARCEHAGMTIT
jgi:hypothetical protein